VGGWDGGWVMGGYVVVWWGGLAGGFYLARAIQV